MEEQERPIPEEETEETEDVEAHRRHHGLTDEGADQEGDDEPDVEAHRRAGH